MAALDWSQCPAVESVPGKVSGAWVFCGTRMPVSVVFENLEDGVTIDGTYALVTNLPVGPQQIYIASELAPNTTGGTLSVSVRLPQRALSFQEVNTTASAGTCTDRFVVGY